MNILQMTSNYTNIAHRKNSAQINFGGKIITPVSNIPEESLLNEKEITANIFKLAKKIQFVSEILGEYGKTVKPVLVKLDEANVYINMDKRAKDKIKINLYSDTDDFVYKYIPDLQMYIPVENPGTQRQSLDIIVSKKDKRMINGQLNIVDCSINFTRDTKTGRREATANKGLHFIPNLYECTNMNDAPVQFWESNKAANIVTSTFFNMFTNMTQVKPEVSLIK